MESLYCGNCIVISMTRAPLLVVHLTRDWHGCIASPMHGGNMYPVHPAVGGKKPAPGVGPNGMPLSFSILQKSPPAASMMGPNPQRPPIEVHENVEQRVKELLEENAKIISTMGDNLVNASPHCNLDLMVRFRNNIFTLQK